MKANILITAVAAGLLFCSAAPGVLIPAATVLDLSFVVPDKKDPKGEPTRTYDVGAFTSVNVGGVIEVIVRKGEAPSAAAYGPSELVDLLVVTNKNGRLSIEMDTKGTTEIKEDVVVVLETPSLEKVSLSGATSGDISGFSGGDMLLAVSGASKVALQVDCEKLSIEASGAADITLSGSANTLVIGSSGVAEIAGEDLKVNDATIEASGNSNIDIHVTGNLQVEASGICTVRYSGTPSNISQEVSGMAKITKS